MGTEFTHQDTRPSPHACNTPGLSPIEFLQAIYSDPLFPMSIRIDAARALLPYTEPRPAKIPSSHIGCTIVIGGLGSYDPSSAQGPSVASLGNDSQNPDFAHKTLTQVAETQAPVKLRNEPDPSNLEPFPNYSTPPTQAELQEIKAAVHALRPDLAHLPTPEFHLCPCGHWITGTYPCCEALRPRDGSKLN